MKTQLKTHSVTKPYIEGRIAKAIEKRTARIPSDVFLWLAGGSLGAAFVTQWMGKNEASYFLRHFAPLFLTLGVYNKIVKVLGSDRLDRSEMGQIGRGASLSSAGI